MSTKTYKPCSFTERQLAEALESESERALGIELSGGGWEALADAMGIEDTDDWDGESESAKRALPRLAPPVHFEALPPLHATTAAVSRSKLAEQDADEITREYRGWHRRWDLESTGGPGMTAYCEDCLDWHTAASREELVELLDIQHPPEPDPDEAYERARDQRD